MSARTPKVRYAERRSARLADRSWPILRGSGRRIVRITAATAYPGSSEPQAESLNSLVWETGQSSDMAVCLRALVPTFPSRVVHGD